MRYILGQFYESDAVGQSKEIKPIDYIIPSFDDNLHYLNVMNTEAEPLFEREFATKCKQQLLQNEQKKDPKFYSRW